MKYFLLLLLSLPVQAANLKFTYMPHEGASPVECKHKQIRDLPDWEVICDQPNGIKHYVAHVVVTNAKKPTHSTLEILYWVTERGLNGQEPRKFQSSSAFLKFVNQTAPATMSLWQGIENDYASLVLEWSAD